jgi:hypothetical protein
MVNAESSASSYDGARSQRPLQEVTRRVVDWQFSDMPAKELPDSDLELVIGPIGAPLLEFGQNAS